ncbi:hypothetical protein LNO75_00650, partial [Mycoplasma sp. T363T]
VYNKLSFFLLLISIFWSILNKIFEIRFCFFKSGNNRGKFAISSFLNDATVEPLAFLFNAELLAKI